MTAFMTAFLYVLAHTFPNSKSLAKFAKNNGEFTLIRTHLEEWLDQKQPTLKASTYNDYYKTVCNILIPAFGDILLSKLRRADVRA